MMVRDEHDAIKGLLEEVAPYFGEIVVLDTGSEDRTWQYLLSQEPLLWPKLQIYQLKIPQDVEHFNFGEVRSVAAHLNHCGYVFMLDADERLTKTDLEHLTKCHNDALRAGWPAVAFPRHNWYDSPEERKNENKDILPDWQVRMIRNDGTHRWQRPVHEVCMEGPVWRWDDGTIGYEQLWLHHHHMWFKKDQKPMDRHEFYKQLEASDPRWLHTYKREELWGAQVIE